MRFDLQIEINKISERNKRCVGFGKNMIFNSQGTENFPFSYFTNPTLKLIKVIKDIKNINTFDKTRTHGLDFR